MRLADLTLNTMLKTRSQTLPVGNIFFLFSCEAPFSSVRAAPSGLEQYGDGGAPCLHNPLKLRQRKPRKEGSCRTAYAIWLRPFRQVNIPPGTLHRAGRVTAWSSRWTELLRRGSDIEHRQSQGVEPFVFQEHQTEYIRTVSHKIYRNAVIKIDIDLQHRDIATQPGWCFSDPTSGATHVNLVGLRYILASLIGTESKD